MKRVSTLCIPLSLCLSIFMVSAFAATQAPFHLKSKTLLEQPSPLRSAFYVHKTGTEMMRYDARSADNGRTWTPQKPEPDFDGSLPKNYRRFSYPGFVDPETGALLAVLLAMDREDVDRNIDEPKETATDSYIRYRVSLDGGRNFLFDEPVIQEGDFNFKHPLEGLYLGKNAIFLGDLGCRPIRTQEGRVLVPTQMTLLDSQGELETYGSGWDYYQCLMLIGTWQEDHRLAWTVSEPIQADPDRSVRGLYEPTLAEMPDGRILCVMRGSNGLKKDAAYQLPSHKWYAVSTDGGVHWSTPEIWHYSNGRPFFSPSSMSQIIQHSSGRYFWIGNLCPTNARGNAPRWPLVLGEIDPESMMLIEDSVFPIDTKEDTDVEGLQLSNFYAFEDRETGDIVLPMQRWTPPENYQWVIYRMGADAEQEEG
ncbi:MAG: exo-alpha-sialidase [Candidatus Hydrogenedentes bacterium]|nr:exo-alpha-sialidase [Candidatus Hydrogenedentota bacterium]